MHFCSALSPLAVDHRLEYGESIGQMFVSLVCIMTNPRCSKSNRFHSRFCHHLPHLPPSPSSPPLSPPSFLSSLPKATDIDSANNHAVIRYERFDPVPGEPFYFHVTELGEIQTAATFRDRIESTYNFTVVAYDNLREDPTFNDFVMIKVSVCQHHPSSYCTAISAAVCYFPVNSPNGHMYMYPLGPVVVVR